MRIVFFALVVIAVLCTESIAAMRPGWSSQGLLAQLMAQSYDGRRSSTTKTPPKNVQNGALKKKQD